MTDYTDLKARLADVTPSTIPVGITSLTDKAAAAIAALEADISRLETAHAQMQRAHDATAAELADLQHDMGRAQAALSAMATGNERLRAALQKHDATLTAPTRG